MISVSTSEWVREIVLKRPMNESKAVIEAARTPSGAILVSDLYQEPLTVETDEDLIHRGLLALSPATDSVRH